MSEFRKLLKSKSIEHFRSFIEDKEVIVGWGSDKNCSCTIGLLNLFLEENISSTDGYPPVLCNFIMTVQDVLDEEFRNKDWKKHIPNLLKMDFSEEKEKERIKLITDWAWSIVTSDEVKQSIVGVKQFFDEENYEALKLSWEKFPYCASSVRDSYVLLNYYPSRPDKRYATENYCMDYSRRLASTTIHYEYFMEYSIDLAFQIMNKQDTLPTAISLFDRAIGLCEYANNVPSDYWGVCTLLDQLI